MVHVGNEKLRERVVSAAQAALSRQHYVSTIDVLTGIGLLYSGHVDSWKKGRIDYLGEMIQGSAEKIAGAIAFFHQWALAQGLEASEASYVRRSPSGMVELRITASGDPAIEKKLRVQYVSPALSGRKKAQIAEKLNSPDQIAVFEIVRDSACSECGAELFKGDLLLMEKGQPLCLPCARLGDLEYLGAGDAALTRRSVKYSDRTAVVVRFSRSRGRYERQGVLVEKPALEKAEQECLEDAGERAEARAKAAVGRKEEDRDLVKGVTVAIGKLFPGCPSAERAAIARHTAVRNSGRVGRSAAGRGLNDKALTAAVVAAVRHMHTEYDELLAGGMERDLARHRIADKVDSILNSWRNRG